jgi:lipopolysaccharide transport system permease protein
MRELWDARELLWSFAVRELSVRYKQTFFGVLWALIQPLSLMVVFTVVFSRIARLDSEGLPYPVFSYTALLPWSFFAASMSLAIPSLANNADLISKVYFPRLVIPLSSLLVAGTDFLVAAAMLVGLFWYYQVSVTWAALYIFPLLLIQTVFAAAVCIFLSALNVFYRDVRYALPLLTQLWIYKVPVIYSAEKVPAQWRTWYMADPMAVVVDGFRRCLLKGQAPPGGDLALAATSAALLLLAALLYFRWVERSFADIV